MGEKILKVAKNKDGYLVDIIDSIKGSKYYCPICGNILQRNFGKIKQYFSHKNGEGSECELKLDAIREYHTPLNDDIDTYLEQEYYGRDFSDIKVKLSNYKSEDGYYLTKEQYDIIHSDEDKIKISALAGSGKTETLYYYAKERPDKRILYIVYNKSMKDEADKTFGELPNVTVKTIHGLAFGFVGKFYRHKLTNKYGVVDIIKDLNLDWNKDIEIASKVDLLMMEYMLTDIEKFEDIDLLRDDPERNIILYFAEKLWGLKKEYKNNVRIEHDFYLKLYQLSKKDLSNQYDILLLDEAQDSNLIVFDIIKASNIDGVVIVGDQLQQIYGWRKSVNIMPLFDAAEYKLTTSFRVGQNIACLANILVQDLTKQNIGMTGFNSEQKIVTKINKNEPFVCLCRTNAYMFNEVFEILQGKRNAKLFFEGGYSGYSFKNIQDAYYFSLGRKVKNYIFEKFDNYYDMISYAKEVEDLEIIALDKMVSTYGSMIPRIIDNISKNTTRNKENADVILSTVHKSKGQTYSIPVYISNDHLDIRKTLVDCKSDIHEYYEEMCIVYVAITRCADKIQLSDKFKEYLYFRGKEGSIYHGNDR